MRFFAKCTLALLCAAVILLCVGRRKRPCEAPACREFNPR